MTPPLPFATGVIPLLQWWEGYVELLVRAGVAEKDASDSSRLHMTGV